MTPIRRLRLAYLLRWLIPALWSSNYNIARAADGVIAPHALGLGRWTLAFVLMLPFAGATLVALAGTRLLHEPRSMAQRVSMGFALTDDSR